LHALLLLLNVTFDAAASSALNGHKQRRACPTRDPVSKRVYVGERCVWLSALQCSFVQVAALEKGSFPLCVASSKGKSQATRAPLSDASLSSACSPRGPRPETVEQPVRPVWLSLCAASPIPLLTPHNMHRPVGSQRAWSGRMVVCASAWSGGHLRCNRGWSRSQDNDTLYSVAYSKNSAHSA